MEAQLSLLKKKGNNPLISSNIHLDLILKHTYSHTQIHTTHFNKNTLSLTNVTFLDLIKTRLLLLLNGLRSGKDVHHHFPEEDNEGLRSGSKPGGNGTAQALEPDRAV